MDDRTAFLMRIRPDPADDAPFMVFADWLEEHDEEDLARLTRVDSPAIAFESQFIPAGRPTGPRSSWRFCREQTRAWESRTQGEIAAAKSVCVRLPSFPTGTVVFVKRGVVRALQLSWGAWIGSGQDVWREHPVGKVGLFGPPAEFELNYSGHRGPDRGYRVFTAHLPGLRPASFERWAEAPPPALRDLLEFHWPDVRFSGAQEVRPALREAVEVPSG